MSLLVIGGDALEPADRDRLFLERVPCGRPARTDGRMCVPESRETHSTSN